jgi:acyl-CoA dehydrogenase
MDFALDDEQSLLVATIRRWSERHLARWAAEADRRGEPPAALWGAAGELGLLMDAVPSEAGGLLDGGASSYSHLARALRGWELGRGCAALAALCESNVEPALAVLRWGSPAARSALYDALTGEPPRLAIPVNDFYQKLEVVGQGAGDLAVRGRLGPLPGLQLASHALVAARAGEEPVLFLLEVPAGVTPQTPSGWRAAAWGSIELHASRVPGEMILARGDAGAVATREVRSWLHSSLAARALGVAAQAIAHATAYGEQRIQFGRPIGRFQSLARMRDENQTAIAAARSYALQAAWEVDRGLPSAADTASRARDLAAQVVSRATIDAVQMYGGYGFVSDFPVEKLMRDARAFEVLGGNEALARVLDQTGGAAPARGGA